MKKKNAFTLIELLVVIAIIAILLAVLMPSLKKAKMVAKTLVCVANCKTLSTAWTTYAAENHDKIVSAWTGYAGYYNPLQDGTVCTNPWVDWAGYPTGYPNPQYKDPVDNKKQVLAVERGVLFPYVKTVKAYRCPLSKKGQARCYSIPDSLGNKGSNGASFMGGQKPVMKASEIRMTSERIVFLDEDDITFGGFTVYYQLPSWWDKPPKRHNNGITLGFADGHSEYYKWKDKQTIDLANGVTSNPSQPGNQDLMRIQRGVYGELGYNP